MSTLTREATSTDFASSRALRRTTGWLFLIGALAFGVAATVLSSTFEWPDILREPADVVLPSFADGGNSLIWTWFAVAWTYGVIASRCSCSPRRWAARTTWSYGPPPRSGPPPSCCRWRASCAGCSSFRRSPATTSPATTHPRGRGGAWMAQHQYGGALLGEHLGELMAIAWSVTVAIVVLRTKVLPGWVGVSGLVVSVLYFLNQGDIMATAIPDFPVWDLAGLLGSTGWGLWVAALGVAILRHRGKR